MLSIPAKWLDGKDRGHTRGAPYRPDPRYYNRTLASDPENRILLENYYLPSDFKAQIVAFVEYYNHRRYHENLNTLAPAEVYFGRGRTIIIERERNKR